MGKKIFRKIKVTPIKIIRLSSGNIMRVMKKKDLSKSSFGEAYFSKIKFNKIKAWKYHKKMVLNLVVPKGKVKFVFYLEKNKIFKVVTLSEKKYSRLTVQPKIWFGFKGVSKPESIILNIGSITHNPKEVLRLKKEKINFNW